MMYGIIIAYCGTVVYHNHIKLRFDYSTGGYVFYNKNWDKEDKEDVSGAGDDNDRITRKVRQGLDEARDNLRKICMHEVIAHKGNEEGGVSGVGDSIENMNVRGEKTGTKMSPNTTSAPAELDGSQPSVK